MTRRRRRLAVQALGLLLASGAAAAQSPAPTSEADEYLAEAAREFAIRPECGPQREEDIVVCGRPEPSERYRLPIRPDRFDPAGPARSVSRERNLLLEENGGGVASCSTVGPGGMYGCAFRQFKRDVEQHGK